MKVAIPDDYPPFYYRDDNGDFRGVSFEIVEHLLRELGYDVEATQLPSMRTLLAELDAGREDLTVNLTATEERRKVALFTTTPHIVETQDLIVRADSPIRYDGDLEKLKDYRFGAIFGWTYGPAFDNAEDLERVSVNSSSDQLRGLLAGQFDIALNNRQFFQHQARDMGVSRAFRVLAPPVFELPVTIAISRRYPQAEALRDGLNSALDDFLTQPAYRDILERYGFGAVSAAAEAPP
ncbi:substrate-binding periplasmic protein [Marinobacterium nitratireducens]|uniref:substrate-binding periplasmic protein n=1 Tax=Marinobacterium nitratireducens TaxID=518897 RepID=UPI0016636563|nr:transporter substrate-binding domain-containing protein [Marinobacterium nitratireducens]